jgi:uncharacterized membrane protein
MWGDLADSGCGADHGKSILPKLRDEVFHLSDQAHYPQPWWGATRRLDHGGAIGGLSSSRQVAVRASAPVIRQAVAPSKSTGGRRQGMGKGRLEAFSDGVIAIIITIMVLELKPPHEPTWHALSENWHVFLSYVLSFVYVGIYWNNHHHMLFPCHRVSGAALWANLHLLFWLSLFPFSTAWIGENHLAPLPTAAYGVVLLMAGVAYLILQRLIIVQQGPDSLLAAAIGRDWKGKLSALAYLAAIPLAFVSPWISIGLYTSAAFTWLIPDRRNERVLDK